MCAVESCNSLICNCFLARTSGVVTAHRRRSCMRSIRCFLIEHSRNYCYCFIRLSVIINSVTIENFWDIETNYDTSHRPVDAPWKYAVTVYLVINVLLMNLNHSALSKYAIFFLYTANAIREKNSNYPLPIQIKYCFLLYLRDCIYRTTQSPIHKII